MTDARLRELERAFKESGSPDDELSWLRERVRQGESLDWDSYSRLAELNVEAAWEYLLARVERGDLEREKLELAALVGYPPARHVDGLPALPLTYKQHRIGMLQALQALPVRVSMGFAFRSVSRAMLEWRTDLPYGQGVAKAQQEIGDWIASGQPEDREFLGHLRRQVLRISQTDPEQSLSNRLAYSAGSGLLSLIEAIQQPSARGFVSAAFSACQVAHFSAVANGEDQADAAASVIRWQQADLAALLLRPEPSPRH